ncbi:MAG: 4'-phosphopantetheinyl transferase superfamily protein [Actinobacteria bacterium]|nr:4'-phosphopantetheinyl transferase superfamily protein [Actinomycetota bacterium]
MRSMLQAAMPQGDDAVRVWQASLAAAAPRCRRLQAGLPADELDRAESLRSPRRRETFLVSRAMLRDTLGLLLGEDPKALRFAAGPHGKPFLEQERRLCFNLSHSGDMVVFATAWDREVGVDVERARVDVDCEALAARFFSPVENEQLASLPHHLRRAAFFAGWTRKEALVKAWGVGLSLALDRFDVSLVPDRPPRLLDVRASAYGATRWSIRDLDPGAGYAGALAVEGAGCRLVVQTWSPPAAEDGPISAARLP